MNGSKALIAGDYRMSPKTSQNMENNMDVNKAAKVAWFTLIVFFAVVVVPQIAFGGMYKWTNADGTIGITDDPNSVPPQYRGQIEQKQEGKNSGGVYYGKSVNREAVAPAVLTSVDAEVTEEKKMTEEEKKKTEKETSAVWENMKKALRGR
jgi:hypothetical protein